MKLLPFPVCQMSDIIFHVLLLLSLTTLTFSGLSAFLCSAACEMFTVEVGSQQFRNGSSLSKLS